MVLSYKSNPYNFVPILVKEINAVFAGWRAKALPPAMRSLRSRSKRHKGIKEVRAMVNYKMK